MPPVHVVTPNVLLFIARWLFLWDDMVITARKRSLRRLCFYTCLSFCPGVWYPSMHCRSRGPHPGGEVEGSGLGGSPGPHPWGGLQAHTWGGGYPSMHWDRHLPCQQTATAAGGTHPTGMHSCSVTQSTLLPVGGGWVGVLTLLLDAAQHD